MFQQKKFQKHPLKVLSVLLKLHEQTHAASKGTSQLKTLSFIEHESQIYLFIIIIIYFFFLIDPFDWFIWSSL
jgi:hypothetical protein